jgi:adenylate kinase
LNLVLIGPPGCGKGTQAARVAQASGVPHISTGEILRHAVDGGSMLGDAVKDSMSRGELVSDEIITDLVAERLADLDATTGFVLDGFPRTVEQAYALDVLMEERGRLAVVELIVPDEELVRRLARRRTAEGRTDDDETVVRERLAVHRRSTQPVIEFYRMRRTLLTVNGDLPPEQVTERITLAVLVP